jgi:serine protease Do
MRCKMKGFLALVLAVGIVGAGAAYAPAQSIADFEEEMIGLVDGVSESIVAVAARSGQATISGAGEGAPKTAAKTVGCGIVIDESGLIITTASVVGHAQSVEVSTRDGVRYAGSVAGVDPVSDIAVIKVESEGFKPARFADEMRLLPGSIILVLGNAFGSLPSVSMGMVSNITALGDEDAAGSLFGLSVAINPGDIGGPVVNTRGEVIGMVIGRLSFQSQPQAVRVGNKAVFGLGGALQPSNMSVAVPATRALGTVAEILEKGSKERGFLGVTVVNLAQGIADQAGESKIKGVVIMDVVPGSPAESVGLEPGDLITAFGPKDVISTTQFANAVRATSPGDVVNITYSRKGTAVSDGVRIGWLVPEYVRQARVTEYGIRPEQVRARIENLKTEIEVLQTQLKELEDRR